MPIYERNIQRKNQPSILIRGGENQIMLIYERNLHRRNQTAILIEGPRKSYFPLNLMDIQIYKYKYRRTDIYNYNYRVASLLEITKQTFLFSIYFYYNEI